MLDHLRRLGVTAVSFYPFIRSSTTSAWSNWDCATTGATTRSAFLRLTCAIRATGTLGEFKTMVKVLHGAGHRSDPRRCLQPYGRRRPLWPHAIVSRHRQRRVLPAEPRIAAITSTTPVPATRSICVHPSVLRLIMDSLRIGSLEMHVDGFRFDLATTLGTRAAQRSTPAAPSSTSHRQDPVLSQVKLIAEPWDFGEDGYQVGNFPPAGPNGTAYRDAVRAYWKGDGGLVGELAQRLSGSSDLFEPAAGGRPRAINFITAHDGFTLRDLVSYNDKHNEANGEDNRDGESTQSQLELRRRGADR